MKLRMIPYVLAKMALMSEPGDTPNLSVHMCEGHWIAAICPLGSRMALLDILSVESLAAKGDTPMDAIEALDYRLYSMGEQGLLP